MKLEKPRISAVPASEWSAEQQEIMAPMMRGEGVGPANVFGTLVGFPKLMKRWIVFANHCLFKSSLSARDRELVILRTAWLAQSEYEWAQHVVIGKREGVTDEELLLLREPKGGTSQHWSAAEVAAIVATDELMADVFISDPTWAALKSVYSEEQIVDLIFLVGQYRGLAGALNSLGVQLDDGLKGF